MFTQIPDTIEKDGFTCTAVVESDEFADSPWDNCDGHGPVTDWTLRTKKPGERVLSSDRHHKRYYDFEEASKIALRDGWGSADSLETDTPKEKARKAVESDYAYLKAWCDDKWHYVGVVVTVSKAGIELATESLWGIESNADSYLVEAANELIGEALTSAKTTLATLVA